MACDLGGGQSRGFLNGYRQGHVYLHVLVRILLRHLHTIHQWWRQKTLLTPDQVLAYQHTVDSFSEAWRATTWQPAVWVHWLVVHSGALMAYHRTLYLFSSIPSERRHQTFKRDLRRSFLGWKCANPSMGGRGFKHVLELDALAHCVPPKRSRQQ